MASPSTTSKARLRLLADLKAVQSDPPEGTSASPESDDNIYLWNATIFGPDESEWEGGIFPLKLKFHDDYPEKAPKVRFVGPMFHPNVYGDGSLCLDILADKWSPIYDVNTILISIRSLLTDPNVKSPANPTAAALYAEDKKEYKKRIRRLVERTQESGFGF